MLHFLIECPVLERRRNYEILDRRIQVPEDRLIQCLFRQNRFQETGKMVKEMWYARRNMLKYEKDTKKEEKSNGEDTKVMRSDPGPKRTAITLDRGRRGVSESRG